MKSLQKAQLEEEAAKEKEESQKKEMPKFLLKLYQILEMNEFNEIIEWGENGKYFIVKNLNEFSQKILPSFYKHNNFSSFVRQLNMYDFHKKKNSNNENIFQHKYFIRGQRNLLKIIKRKTSQGSNAKNQEEETGLIEYCQKEITSTKRVSKSKLEKSLYFLINSISETNEKQKQLEEKIIYLAKQNENFIFQNQQILQEIVSKSEYTQKLERLLFFLFDLVLPVTTYQGIAKSVIHFDGNSECLLNWKMIEGFLENKKKSDIKMLMGENRGSEIGDGKIYGDAGVLPYNNIITSPNRNITPNNNEDGNHNGKEKTLSIKSSPNPFFDDYSNICAPAHHNGSDDYNMYFFESENHKESSILSSMDFAELYKTQINLMNEEELKKETEKNLWLDDCHN